MSEYDVVLQDESLAVKLPDNHDASDRPDSDGSHAAKEKLMQQINNVARNYDLVDEAALVSSSLAHLLSGDFSRADLKRHESERAVSGKYIENLMHQGFSSPGEAAPDTSAEADAVFKGKDRIYPVRIRLFLRLLRELNWLSRAKSSDSTNTRFEGVLQLVEELKPWMRVMNNIDRFITAQERQLESIKQHSVDEEKLAGARSVLAQVEGRMEDPQAPDSQMQIRLHELQLKTLKQILAAVEEGKLTGYVEAPTGIGKTAMFVSLIGAAGDPSLIVVPTLDIAKQTVSELEKFVPNVSADDVAQLYTGGQSRPGAPITVTTYASLERKLSEKPDSDSIDPRAYRVVICDEAHRGTTDQRAQAIAQFDQSLVVGFSATPDYSEVRRAEHVFGNEYARITLQEAYDAGLIAGFQNWYAEVEWDNDMISMLRAELETGQPISDQTLARIIDTEARNNDAIAMYEYMLKHVYTEAEAVPTLIYCASIDHASHVATMFTDKGVVAEVIHGQMNEEERQAVISRVRSGKTKVLCGNRLIVEGLNIPELMAVFKLAPTYSKVVAQQTVGRGLRAARDLCIPGFPHSFQKTDSLVVVIDFLPQQRSAREGMITAAMATGLARLGDDTFGLLKDHSINHVSKTGGSPDGGQGLRSTGVEATNMGFSLVDDPKEVAAMGKAIAAGTERFRPVELPFDGGEAVSSEQWSRFLKMLAPRPDDLLSIKRGASREALRTKQQWDIQRNTDLKKLMGTFNVQHEMRESVPVETAENLVIMQLAQLIVSASKETLDVTQQRNVQSKVRQVYEKYRSQGPSAMRRFFIQAYQLFKQRANITLEDAQQSRVVNKYYRTSDLTYATHQSDTSEDILAREQNQLYSEITKLIPRF